MAENKKRDGLGIWLYILLCLVTLVLGVVSWGAYLDLKISEFEREGLLATVGQQMIDTRINKNPEDPANLKQLRIILSDFRVIAEGMAQNDNKTFLFTIFSIALVSGSAYLLDQSRQNVKAIEDRMGNLRSEAKDLKSEAEKLQKNTKVVEDRMGNLKSEAKDLKSETEKLQEHTKKIQDVYFKKKMLIDKISESFVRAEAISNNLQYEDDEKKFFFLLSPERQELDKSYKALESNKLEGNKHILDEAQIENYKKKAFGIKAKLQSVQTKFQEAVQELVTKCEEIIRLCKSLQICD